MAEVDIGVITRRATVSGLAGLGLLSLTLRSNAERPVKFGAIVPDAHITYYERMLRGMAGEAKILGIELKIFEFSFEPTREVDVIEQAISEKFDGYLIAPLPNDKQAARLVELAIPSGAWVAAVNRRVPGASVTVLPDLAAAAAMQAKIAMTIAPAKATFLYIAAPPGLIEPDVVQPFSKAVEGGGFSVIIVTAQAFAREMVVREVAEALSAHPSVSIIAAAADPLALWAVDAAAQIKRPVQVIGLGASAEGAEAVKKKLLVATIDLRPDVQGATAVRSLAKVHDARACDNHQNPPCPEQLIQPQTIVAQ